MVGVLTMFVDKETYERAGLVGKPYGAKGGRGSKPRWGEWPDSKCQKQQLILVKW